MAIFDCSQLAKTCAHCLTLEERYDGCGWCVADNRCTSKHACEQGDFWLSREKPCQNVYISDFSPKKGPIEGGTEVKISGENMGKTIEDIFEITVAGTQCKPNADSYVAGEKVSAPPS